MHLSQESGLSPPAFPPQSVKIQSSTHASKLYAISYKLKKRAEPASTCYISKLGLNSKIKKFSYSFICGKGYSPPFGGE